LARRNRGDADPAGSRGGGADRAVPWGLVYEAIAYLGVPRDAFTLATAFEARLPVWEWSELLYASTYPLVLLSPFVVGSRQALRALARRGLAASAAGFATYLLVPVIAPPRPFVAVSFLGRILQEERRYDTELCAFPSFHAAWIVLAMTAFASRFPRLRPLLLGYAGVVCVSCVTTGMHSIADVVAGALLAYAACRVDAIWELLRRTAERVANSWSEVRVGRLRIINYAAYGALSTGLGVFLALTFAGPGNDLSILVCGIAAILGAGAWAQWIEGSSRLLRPYGFYGGLLGIVGAALAAPLTGGSVWAVLGAFALAGPFIQAAGRLRCLVQGCCHGAEAPANIGIRYTHPMSRVCRFSELGGKPVHPTPLYSILWNGLTFAVLFRLATLSLPLRFIAGMYLVASGLGRFVEESYRGEPQTPVVGGLRAYQWAALGSLLVGGLLTALPLGDARPAAFVLRPASVAYGLAFGLLTAFVSGVDFPGSKRRFSRLT
jgi:membrane-associated phospholipid phosphatase